MKKFVLLFVVLFAGAQAYSQTTFDQVYSLLQTDCATPYCHATGGAILDLEGAGVDPQADVYDNLVGVTSYNVDAQTEGFKIVYPGDPYRSTLFRWVNQGLDDWCPLIGSEQNMPQGGGELADTEKELIRQWILFGASDTSNFVDTAAIADYYAGNGIDANVDPIMAPDPSEGFQIKMGPYFISPEDNGPLDGEIEMFLKYPLENAETIEVNRVDNDLGLGYSHHFIIFRFREAGEVPSIPTAGNPDNFRDGLRIDNAHNDVSFVTVSQESDQVELPTGTAFTWAPNTVLDLNAHFINYSDQVLKAVNYINVYTQPAGAALQQMYTELYVNWAFSIPGDGADHTFESEIYDAGNSDEMYIWQMTSHTHKLGKDFEVYHRDVNGDMQDQIFDAEYHEGDPQGLFIGFDYQHPPVRYWYHPFLPIVKEEGMIQVAKYNNPENNPTIYWGDTSEDEMMITMVMYLEDTVGLSQVNPVKEVVGGNAQTITVYPNPTEGALTIRVNDNVDEAVITIYSPLGQLLLKQALFNNEFVVDLEGFSKGLYLYQVETGNGAQQEGKLIVK